MSNLRCRELEDEYLGILSDLDGDAEGRELAASYLASAHPVANREGTPTWALTPKVLTSAELGILREAAETMGRIIEKVTARYLDDADFRARFGLSPEFEALHPHFAEALRQLRAHSRMTVAHEHLFHTVLGLLGIETPFYAPELDLCNPAAQPYDGEQPDAPAPGSERAEREAQAAAK